MPGDVLGRAYEYLIKQFADDAGAKAGEFFTPPLVVDTLVWILEPQPGDTIYDPTSGSGGMLVHTADYLREHEKSDFSGFWIEMWSTLTTKSNYPFTPLRNCAERDLKSISRLDAFSINILKAGRERIELEEAELRERLNVIAGSPSLAVPITLLAAGWTAWKNYNEASNAFTVLVLVATSLSFALCLFAASHRALPIRLARSRALLALEIARRLSEEPARP